MAIKEWLSTIYIHSFLYGAIAALCEVAMAEEDEVQLSELVKTVALCGAVAGAVAAYFLPRHASKETDNRYQQVYNESARFLINLGLLTLARVSANLWYQQSFAPLLTLENASLREISRQAAWQLLSQTVGAIGIRLMNLSVNHYNQIPPATELGTMPALGDATTQQRLTDLEAGVNDLRETLLNPVLVQAVAVN